MKRTFFVYRDRRAGLYCSTEAYDGVTLRGYVINGAWSFKLNTTTGVMEFETPSGHSEIDGCKVLWTNRKFAHYNDAILWVNAHLSRPVLVRVVVDLYEAIREPVGRFASRFTRACKAFSASWNGRVNDDVPY